MGVWQSSLSLKRTKRFGSGYVMQSFYQAKIKSYDMFFPYVMALDNSGIILAANENLVRRIQGHGVGKQFLDEFKLSIDNQSATESFEALPVHT
jgi:hypothetical protein